MECSVNHHVVYMSWTHKNVFQGCLFVPFLGIILNQLKFEVFQATENSQPQIPFKMPILSQKFHIPAQKGRQLKISWAKNGTTKN